MSRISRDGHKSDWIAGCCSSSLGVLQDIASADRGLLYLHHFYLYDTSYSGAAGLVFVVAPPYALKVREESPRQSGTPPLKPPVFYPSAKCDR